MSYKSIILFVLLVTTVDITIAADNSSVGYVIVNKGQVKIIRNNIEKNITKTGALYLNDVVTAIHDSIAVIVLNQHKPSIIKNGESLILKNINVKHRRLSSHSSSDEKYLEIAQLFMPGYSYSGHSSDVVKGKKTFNNLSPRFIYPIASKILTTRPKMAWSGPEHEYRLRLYKSSDPYLWLHEKIVKGSKAIDYPANWPSLINGEKYFLELTTTSVRSASTTTEFEVASVSEKELIDKKVEDIKLYCTRQSIIDVNCQLIQAGFMKRNGYSYETMILLKELKYKDIHSAIVNMAINNLIEGE